MKKADITQALAEQAANYLSDARVLSNHAPNVPDQTADYEEFAALERYQAGVKLAAINHINGVSPTQE